MSWYKSRIHHGVVLDVSAEGFDKGAATFSTVFVDEDDENTMFMFYSGAQDTLWSRSAIGLATSQDGLKFRKVGKEPVLEGTPISFCYREALTPAVIRMKNRFYMVFSGRPLVESSRRIGIAYADDPKGEWHIIGELIKPLYAWENRHIENGPSVVKLNDETALVFYSNVSPSALDILTFVRQLLLRRKISFSSLDVRTFLRRYMIRRLGILKLRIRGPSKSDIEVSRFSGNPLKHLNGPKGSWNESLFCPGYFCFHGKHYLIPATSVYSAGFPYKRYVGLVASDSLYFSKSTLFCEKLIDGPLEKRLLMPEINSEISLDSPSPYLSCEKNKLFLYYSVMDQSNDVWKTALTTFDFNQRTR